MPELAELSPRKQRYVKERASGKSKRQSALAAGYSETVANVAGPKIETPDVRAVFAELMRRKVPPGKVVLRVQQGLDAKETVFFQKDGIVTDQRDVVSWSERRQYAKLAAEFAGYYDGTVPRSPIPPPQVNTAINLVVQSGTAPDNVTVTTLECERVNDPPAGTVTGEAPEKGGGT